MAKIVSKLVCPLEKVESFMREKGIKFVSGLQEALGVRIIYATRKENKMTFLFSHNGKVTLDNLRKELGGQFAAPDPSITLERGLKKREVVL